jgi:hypothetical protein
LKFTVSAIAGTSLAGDSDPLSNITRFLPPWIVLLVTIMVTGGWFATQIKPLAPLVRWLARVLKRLLGRADAEGRSRIRRRRKLARSIEARLLSLAEDTRWDDQHYAELEAEIEIEGRELLLPWWRRSPSRMVALRRVRSLTRAIERSTEPIIVLEGEPGSGKSVALRHLALRLATRAQRGTDPAAVIPFYLDLKVFQTDGPVLTPDEIHEFVLNSMNGDREIAGILAEDFDPGLRDGSWLLLFDSFDEIPSILSATESDAVVRDHAEAIIKFLRARECRAVIASREFRGPPSFRLPRFRVVPLTGRRQRVLIRRSKLDRADQQTVRAGIVESGPGVAQMVSNPLFLWLLCEFVRSEKEFPASTHAVFESYANHRFDSDTTRLQKMYGLSPQTLRAYTEEIAFCMAARPGLGLNPTRTELRAAFAADGRLSTRLLDRVLDALVQFKLGRGDTVAGRDAELRFTFTHRRLQEYFATCVVLRAPDRVALVNLLTDGHWRETAITILQIQDNEIAMPLLAAAEEIIRKTVHHTAQPDSAPASDQLETQDGEPRKHPFEWPPGLLHLLEVITIGSSRAPERIPAGIRTAAGEVLNQAWRYGRGHDQLWVLDVAVAAPDAITTAILTAALNSPSGLLRQAAYRHASWLPDLTAAIRSGIRRTLFTIWASGQLSERAPAVRAQLQRLQRAPELLSAYRLLRSVAAIDLLLLTGVGGWIGSQLGLVHAGWWPLLGMAILLAHGGLLIRRDGLVGTVQFDRMPIFLKTTRLMVPSPNARRWVGRALRIIIAGIMLRTVIVHGSPSTVLFVVDCVIVYYGFFWADVAMGQVVFDRPTSARWWPLIPFYPLLWWLRWKMELWSEERKLRRTRPRRNEVKIDRPAVPPRRLIDRFTSVAMTIMALAMTFAMGLGGMALVFGFVVVVAYGLDLLSKGFDLLFGGVGYLVHLIGLDRLVSSAGHLIGAAFGSAGHLIGAAFGWVGSIIPSWVESGVSIVIYGIIAVFFFVLIPISIVSKLTEPLWSAAATNRWISRELDGRSTPYDAKETIAALNKMRTSDAVRQFVRGLREAPQLCSQESIAVLSDLATAARDGGHQRYKPGNSNRRYYSPRVPAKVTVPDGSSVAFANWADWNTKHVADLLLRINQDTIDEITMLVAEARRPHIS